MLSINRIPFTVGNQAIMLKTTPNLRILLLKSYVMELFHKNYPINKINWCNINLLLSLPTDYAQYKPVTDYQSFFAIANDVKITAYTELLYYMTPDGVKHKILLRDIQDQMNLTNKLNPMNTYNIPSLILQ